MSCFDYVKPEIIDFNYHGAKGVSCAIDCTTDDICPGGDVICGSPLDE